jgi:hypothetical protein
MKIRPLRAELFHADRQTDTHDKANSPFSQLLRTRLKMGNRLKVTLVKEAVCAGGVPEPQDTHVIDAYGNDHLITIHNPLLSP